MVGSLWTGISGLATHQAALDNESHNISNVNTIGYKSSRISFADQMYQDSIGKGSKVVNAEKVYSQGGMKTTGVAYDIALQGSGFLAVRDPNATGSVDEFYTRAGNLRMGESGNLQDATQFDVLGWGISPIAVADDVISTNPNVVNFTNSYPRVAANQIVKLDGNIETITGKFTDYSATAENDDKTVVSGLGYKTLNSKISDVETLTTEYQNRLKSYADDPTANSSPSIAQVSVVSLPIDGSSAMSSASDQVYIYIDGTKHVVSYEETIATADLNGDGNTDTNDDKLASKIATYQALADKISKVPGLKAYIAESTVDLKAYIADPTGVADDKKTILKMEGADDTATYSGKVNGNPTIVIESLIPGKEFVIGDVAEFIGTTKATIPGQKSTLENAVSGSGLGAAESARDALMVVGSGFQRDVWSDANLPAADAGGTIAFTITDPNDSAVIFSLDPTIAPSATTIDDLVTAINANTDMKQVVKAHNYNGNLVVETINTKPGDTFVASMVHTDAASKVTVQNKSTTLSVNSGADAEFIEIVNRLDQNAARGSLQLRLDNLGISDSAFGDFSIDSSGVVMMTQDNATYAVGQVAIAMFNNERALVSEGSNKYSKTTNSGNAIYNTNNDKTALIESKTLELSTADLSESLVNLMVFQRAFEANSKSITTSDQILTTLIQLKK